MTESAKPKRPLRIVLLRLAILVVGFYAIIVALAVLNEDWLVHMPGGPDSWSTKPDESIVDVSIPLPDAKPIHGWWYPTTQSGETHAILYFHGKGGNLSHRGRFVRDLASRSGSEILMIDFPGYGRSDGKLGEADCNAAALAAYRWLLDEKKIPEQRITVLGESLGGGPAVELAPKVPCGRLVLACTYTSIPEAAEHRFWWLPCRWLMHTKFENEKRLRDVTCPVIIVHGTNDETIPFSHGERLFAAANEPKRFIRLEGRRHSDYATDEVIDELSP